MPIRKPQIRALEEGDVIFLKVQPIGHCCMAVLERNLSKLVLSTAAGSVEKIMPIRSPQWGEYLIVDEAGNICEAGGNDITGKFLDGEILIGRAMDVAKKYRSRIMPDMKLLKDEAVLFTLSSERKDEVLRTVTKICYMVFNNDCGDNELLLFEMFTRLVKGAPTQELPVYLNVLVSAMNIFSQIQGALKTLDPSDREVRLGDEAAELLNRVRRGTLH